MLMAARNMTDPACHVALYKSEKQAVWLVKSGLGIPDIYLACARQRLAQVNNNQVNQLLSSS